MAISGSSKRIVKFFSLLLFVMFLTFLVPQSIGLGAGGFDSSETLSQFSFYLSGIAFAIILIAGFFVEMAIRRGDNKYGNSIGFSSPGESPSPSFFGRLSQFQIFLISSIIFSILGIIGFLTKQASFTGIPSLEQQFTPTAQLLFSTFLVSGSENLGLAAVIVFSFVMLRIMARKFNWSTSTFLIYSFLLIPIISGLYGVINHLLRYSGQDFSIAVVFFFWLVMGLLTVGTGSFIPAWVMHGANNLFIDLQRLFSSDVVLTMTIGIIALLGVGYWIIYRKKMFGKKGGV